MYLRTLGFAVCLISTISLAQPPAPVQPAVSERYQVQLPGWAPQNAARVNEFLAEYGIGGAKYDPAQPPVAVFDWDNTCIFNDVGEATFYHQVRALYLKLTAAEMERVLPDAAGGGKVSFAKEKAQTLAAYRELENAKLVGPAGFAQLPAVKYAAMAKDPALRRAWQLLCYRLVWFYDRLEEMDGATVAYPWVTRLYANLRPIELKTLVERTLADELRAPGQRCAKLTITHPDGREAGEPIVIKHGIVATAEIKELIGAMHARGFEVYIVTASFQPVVAAIAGRYGVAPDHVIGLRLAVRSDGTFSDAPEGIVTYKQGKVEAIRKHIGREPVFAAGDSEGDLEMLHMPGVQLGLVIDRYKKGELQKICDRARSGDARWIVQGRDDYEPDGTAPGTWNGTRDTRP